MQCSTVCDATEKQRCAMLQRSNGVRCYREATVCDATEKQRCAMLQRSNGVRCYREATVCDATEKQQCAMLQRSNGVRCYREATVCDATEKQRCAMLQRSNSAGKAKAHVTNVSLMPLKMMEIYHLQASTITHIYLLQITYRSGSMKKKLKQTLIQKMNSNNMKFYHEMHNTLT